MRPRFLEILISISLSLDDESSAESEVYIFKFLNITDKKTCSE